VAAWLSSLARGRMLEIAIAVGLGYAIAQLADTLVLVPVGALSQHVGDDPYFGDDILDLQSLYSVGVYRLNFEIAGTVIFYGDVIATVLTLGLVALVAIAVVRRRNREFGVCPFCASRIPYESTHCAYCGSGVAPGEPE
jgi:large-conductance mechanosensitive channel